MPQQWLFFSLAQQWEWVYVQHVYPPWELALWSPLRGVSTSQPGRALSSELCFQLPGVPPPGSEVPAAAEQHPFPGLHPPRAWAPSLLQWGHLLPKWPPFCFFQFSNPCLTHSLYFYIKFSLLKCSSHNISVCNNFLTRYFLSLVPLIHWLVAGIINITREQKRSSC